MEDTPERVNLSRLKWACREYNAFFRRENEKILRGDVREAIVRDIKQYADFLKSHLTSPVVKPADWGRVYDSIRKGFVKDERFDYSGLFCSPFAELTEEAVVKSKIIDLFERAYPLIKENKEKTPLKNRFGIGYADMDISLGVDEEGEPIYCFNEIDDVELYFQRALVRSFADNLKTSDLDRMNSDDVGNGVTRITLEFLPTPEHYKMFEPHGLRIEHDNNFVGKMNRYVALTEDELNEAIVGRYVMAKLQKGWIEKTYR